jgi:hypothetical protein
MASFQRVKKRLKIVVIDADIDIEYSENITVEDVLKVVERLLLVTKESNHCNEAVLVKKRIVKLLNQ